MKRDSFDRERTDLLLRETRQTIAVTRKANRDCQRSIDRCRRERGIEEANANFFPPRPIAGPNASAARFG